MNKEQMIELSKPYGVKTICFGDCIRGSPIHPGQPAAIRRSAHAHNCPKDLHYGVICFKAHTAERVKITTFWHEVAHIFIGIAGLRNNVISGHGIKQGICHV